MSSSNPIADAFDVFNRVRLQSTVLEEIWRQAYGQDYAADAKPDAFYPLSVLEGIIAEAGPHVAGRNLLDIGCGHGMTGLFLVHRLNMKLFGIDVSPASIELAQKTASARAMDAKFWVGDAASTELKDSTCAIVTCLDVLLYLTDKLAFFREMRRILEPEGLLAFTTWEQAGYSSRLGAQQVEDYRPLLEEAGFTIQSYDKVDGASEQQCRVFDGLIEHEDALRDELGEGPTSMFMKMAQSAKEESGGRRYIFGMARRKEE